MSRNSAQSAWVMLEMGGALVLNKRIVQVLALLKREELPSHCAPPKTADIKSIDLKSIDLKSIDLNDFDDYLTELGRRLNKRKADLR